MRVDTAELGSAESNQERAIEGCEKPSVGRLVEAWLTADIAVGLDKVGVLEGMDEIGRDAVNGVGKDGSIVVERGERFDIMHERRSWSFRLSKVICSELEDDGVELGRD
jgi:hypothetical protein